MCLLTYIQPDVVPDMADLENGALNNPDGHGWAILSHGEIHVGHSMDMDVALTLFELARGQMQDGPAIFHSRIATAGNVDTYNCHPFYVNGDRRTVLAHNGILPRSAQPDCKDPRSDTHKFATVWLPKGNYGHFHSRTGRKRLSRWMGIGNKMAMLTTDPAYSTHSYIINAHMGDWVDGVWFSNSSWKDEPWWMDPKWSTSVGGWREEDMDAVAQATASTGYILGNREPQTTQLQLTSGKETTSDPTRDLECKHCYSKGMIGSITYACHACHTCQVCDRSVDNCKCDLGSASIFSDEDTFLANEAANAIAALKEDTDKDYISDLERAGTWGNDGIWRAD